LKFPLGVALRRVIEGVEPGSPAEKAGLRAATWITVRQRTAVKTASDVVNRSLRLPRQQVKITYYRANR